MADLAEITSANLFRQRAIQVPLVEEEEEERRRKTTRPLDRQDHD